MSLLAVGISHQTAPVALLEQFAMDDAERVKTLHEQRDGCGPVAHAHGEQAHRATCSRTRCWLRKASTCSSTDRSTWRTSTPAGATRVTGAKFKMLLTPAATRRSHTDCATSSPRE